jgi:enamine deaminase RidA (YjgF/YER057c/UK114 family)
MNMNKRINISSGSPWEDIVGYSRAVRVGNVIEVTGTVSDDAGTLVGKDDPYAQTKFALLKIEKALIAAGGSLNDVVRTRMFVTNIDQWEDIDRAHQEIFGNIKPCSTMVEISRFIGPDYLIEIEATAILQD